MKNSNDFSVVPVSVLMSVYNGSATVSSSIESILNQTFSDFEFIIVDDGSTDDTSSILRHYADRDPRVKVLTKRNGGLTKALNFGARAAVGRYIARQDADDISLPDRLRVQLDEMHRRPDIALLGANAIWDDGSLRVIGRYYPDSILQSTVFRQNPFAHTSVMFSAKAFRELGGYDESFYTSQDFELWMRFAKQYKISMVNNCLVVRKWLPTSISKSRRFEQIKNGFRARVAHSPYGLISITRSSSYQLLCAVLPKAVLDINRFVKCYKRKNRRIL